MTYDTCLLILVLELFVVLGFIVYYVGRLNVRMRVLESLMYKLLKGDDNDTIQ